MSCVDGAPPRAAAHCYCLFWSAGVRGRPVCVYEHIPRLWTRTCGETLSQNRTERLHAPQTTRQRGTFYPGPVCLFGTDFLLALVVKNENNNLYLHMAFKKHISKMVLQLIKPVYRKAKEGHQLCEHFEILMQICDQLDLNYTYIRNTFW